MPKNWDVVKGVSGIIEESVFIYSLYTTSYEIYTNERLYTKNIPGII